jgi:heat shock protein HspQ
MFNSDYNQPPGPDPDNDPQDNPWEEPQEDGERFVVPDFFPDELPLFMPGTLIRHRRYGYRGIVVDFDMSCLADEQWYEANPAHPDRDQPWYHVLVHGSTINTYAAQENLVIDDAAGRITHPLIEHFFEDANTAGYLRNDELWPSFEA